MLLWNPKLHNGCQESLLLDHFEPIQSISDPHDLFLENSLNLPIYALVSQAVLPMELSNSCHIPQYLFFPQSERPNFKHICI